MDEAPPGLDQFLAQGPAPAAGTPPPPGLDEFIEQEQYGTGGQQALAGVEGLLRGATLGASDIALTKSGLASPEEVKGRMHANPGTNFVGSGLGGAALVGLTGGAAAPVEAALGSSLIGGAAEGALFGAGNIATDYALGDPDLNAQKMLSHVLMGAGLGAGLSAIGKGIEAAPALLRRSGLSEGEASGAREALQSEGFLGEPPIEAAESMTANGEPLRNALNLKNLSPEEQEGILGGLSKLKPNAESIVSAANEIGAPVPEGMVSGSKHIQRLENMLQTSPTPVGVGRQQLYQKGYDAAANATSNALGGLNESTAREAGEKLQSTVTDWFEKKSGPVKELYNQIEEYAPAIPITDKSTGSIARNIRNIINEEGFVKGTAEHDFVNTFADGLAEIQNLQQMKKFRTALARATTPETKFVSGVIKEKLDNLEMNAIKRFSGEMKTPEAKQKILDLMDQITEAKKGYAALRGDMEQVGKNVLGKRKIYGPQDFIDSIEEMTPEKFVKKLFSKDNSKFMEWMAKESPESMQILSQYQRSALREAATKDGVLQPGTVFRSMDKISPEVKAVLFDPAEVRKMEAAQTYLEAMPPDWNPSHTSSMESYRQFFEHPIAATLQTAKDFAAKGIVKAFVNTKDAERATQMGFLQRGLDKFNRTMNMKAKDAIRGGLESSGLRVMEKMSDSDFKKKTDQIKKLYRDPQTLMEHVSSSIEPMTGIAPNISQGLSKTMMTAIQYLHSQIGEPAEHFFLSKEHDPSQFEKRHFAQAFQAVNDPLIAFDQIKNGTLTSQTVQAVATVHPELYQEMKKTLMEHMKAERDIDLPYGKKIAIAKFLGQPLDANMVPGVMASNQIILNSPSLSSESAPKMGRKTEPLGPVRNIKIASRSSTRTNREEEV